MKKLSLSLLLLAAFAIVCSAETFTVIATNSGFQPQNLTVSVGDKVEWMVSEDMHTTTSGAECTPDGKWDSGEMTEGMKYEHTFSAEGTYPYFCVPHCAMGMTGVITVVTATGVKEDAKNFANSTLKNYPNPFINTTTFNITAEKAGKADLQILALDGKLISRQIVTLSRGQNILPLHVDVPAGVYIVRMQLEGILTETRIVARKQ